MQFAFRQDAESERKLHADETAARSLCATLRGGRGCIGQRKLHHESNTVLSTTKFSAQGGRNHGAETCDRYNSVACRGCVSNCALRFQGWNFNTMDRSRKKCICGSSYDGSIQAGGKPINPITTKYVVDGIEYRECGGSSGLGPASCCYSTQAASVMCT